MTIKENTLVAITYTLTVDGEVIETVTSAKPLEFPYGIGFMLPKFEQNIEGLAAGDKFEFDLTVEEGYGEIVEDMIVELSKDVFMVDGVVNEEILAAGSMLPMMDSEGNRLMGIVKENRESSILMDFNHPMAGKALSFVGAVESVGELTPEKLAELTGGAGGCSCGCGDDCGSEDCGSGCDSGCGCK